MALLDKPAFEAKWGTNGSEFPTNTTGLITAVKVREFGQDVADNFYSGGLGLAIKSVNIGDWDMDTDGSKNVAHGLSDFKKIRGIDVIIRNDSDTAPYHHLSNSPSAAIELWINGIDNSNIGISRRASGNFDSTSYDSTSYNRGWITITYEL
jgi:hypothetical protein